jgi:peptidoglycan/LPS O-acetylase OafA/YrhL
MIVTWLQPLFFIVFMLLIHYSRYITSKKALSLFMILGGITYPLYLIHQTVGRTLLNYFGGSAPRLVLIGVMMSFMIAVSYGAFRLDEQLRKKLALKLGFRRA